MDGGDLYQRILEYQQRGRYMSESFVWTLAIQLAQALAALHAMNILHRDIKSANVFLTLDGRVKLGDMNVSKVAKQGLLHTQTGTPYYASPEVWQDRPYDHKSDVWSLGCVLYEAAALKPPFRADDMPGLYRKVVKGEFVRIPRSFSQDLQSFLESLLRVDPIQRPSSAEILRLPQLERRIGKYEELVVEKQHCASSTLLETIKFPRAFQYLSERLPGPCYEGRIITEPKTTEECALPRLPQDRRDSSTSRARFSRKLSTEPRARERSEHLSREHLKILRENYGALRQLKPRVARVSPMRLDESRHAHEMSLDAIKAGQQRKMSGNGRFLSQRGLQESSRLRALKLLPSEPRIQH